MELTDFQNRLIDALQEGIGLCSRPFEELARRLEAGEAEVLEQTARLKDQGIIRRFRGQIDYRKLGRVATLVTAQVPAEKLESTAAAVSALKGVSHNYLRDHAFNLWFTLQDKSHEKIDGILADLEQQTGVRFFSLPAVKLFKLDVRFGVVGGVSAPQAAEVPAAAPKAVALTEREKTALRVLQQEVPLVSRPFAQLADALDESQLLDAAGELKHKGVLRKVAAVANQYRLGYAANAMFCAAVPAEYVEPIGLFLAKYRQVSHCYERRTTAAWPYNLYAMIHTHTEELLQAWVEELTRTVNIENFAVLRTVKELKKEPVKLEL